MFLLFESRSIICPFAQQARPAGKGGNVTIRREKSSAGSRVQEFDNGGRLITHVDGAPVDLSFDEACEAILAAADHEYEMSLLHG